LREAGMSSNSMATQAGTDAGPAAPDILRRMRQ
jgi:hypothetical protein